MSIDDIKLFAKNKNKKRMKTLTHAVRIYSQDIGMEFGIEKCVMRVIERGKRHLTEEWNDQVKTRLERSEKRKPTNTWEF